MIWLAHNLPRAFKIEGRLDVEAVRGLFRALLRRHSVLRTSFVAQDGELFQCIHQHVDCEVIVRDLSGLSASWRELEARTIASQQARKPFDLEQAAATAREIAPPRRRRTRSRSGDPPHRYRRLVDEHPVRGNRAILRTPRTRSAA